jgi:hypothetical protein
MRVQRPFIFVENTCQGRLCRDYRVAGTMLWIIFLEFRENRSGDTLGATEKPYTNVYQPS